MNMRCNLTPEEEGQAYGLFRQYLDQEEESAFSAAFTQYCFYETWGRKDFRECVCTSCGRFEMDRKTAPAFFGRHHRDEITCPRCGEAVTLYALGRMKTGKGLEEWKRAAFLRPGPDGEALIEAGYGYKRYGFDNLRPEVEWEAAVRTYLRPGKRMQWKRGAYTNICGQMFCDQREWEKRPTVQEPFRPNMYGNDGSYLWFGGEKLEQTSLRYCQLRDWYLWETGCDLEAEPCRVRQVVRYLSAYTEYPQLEMAVKFELHGAVNDLVLEGKKNHKYLNWSGKTPAEFLRLDQQEAKIFLRQERIFLDLVAYKDGKKRGALGSFAQYLDIVGRLEHREQVKILCGCAKTTGVELNRAIKYLESQTPQCARAGVSMGTVLQYWKDYLDMAAKLQYDMTERTVALPKDLKERHDTAARLIRIQESAEQKKKYGPRHKNLKKLYGFTMDGLTIVVPEGVQDILREGRILHHCVGGYADRHMEGKVDILFLRRTRKPDTPFLTIEMKPRKSPLDKVCLMQIHGYKNEWCGQKGERRRPEDKYAWFLETWFSWMRDGSKRDKNGRPVLPAGKERTA